MGKRIDGYTEMMLDDIGVEDVRRVVNYGKPVDIITNFILYVQDLKEALTRLKKSHQAQVSWADSLTEHNQKLREKVDRLKNDMTRQEEKAQKAYKERDELAARCRNLQESLAGVQKECEENLEELMRERVQRERLKKDNRRTWQRVYARKARRRK